MSSPWHILYPLGMGLGGMHSLAPALPDRFGGVGLVSSNSEGMVFAPREPGNTCAVMKGHIDASGRRGGGGTCGICDCNS